MVPREPFTSQDVGYPVLQESARHQALLITTRSWERFNVAHVRPRAKVAVVTKHTNCSEKRTLRELLHNHNVCHVAGGAKALWPTRRRQ